MARIRILVVDDSVVIRKVLSDTLSADCSLEVVGVACDGRIALAKIPLLKPKAGIYRDYALRSTTDYYKKKYFSAMDNNKLEVRPEVKKLVAFSRLNLQDDSKMVFMKGMDLIFCCNVLIYFDGVSKSKVIHHFFSNLNLGGYFFLGTSESLMNLNEQFRLAIFPGVSPIGNHPRASANYDILFYHNHS